MTITSYAQNFEDVILWRALKHVERGNYIDIGAQDPVIDSVSLAFYEQGWRGVHVEPTPHYAGRIRSARPDEEVVEAAISNATSSLTFFEFPETGLSTGDELIARLHEAKGHSCRRIDVSAVPLSQILEEQRDKDIHWLKIDVEGMEEQVIASWAPSSVRPWIVVVESTKPTSQEVSFLAWEPQLLALGYEFVYFDGLNRFYVSIDHPELKAGFGPGPNIFDDFVLSGLASAPFCHTINAEKAQLNAETIRLNQVLDSVRIEAAQALDAARAEAAQALDAARAEAAHRLSAARAEAARALHAARAEADFTRAERDAARFALQEATNAWEQDRARLLDNIALKEKALSSCKAEIAQRNRELEAVYRSTSWRVAAPLRLCRRGAGWFVRGTTAWLLFKPSSRPHRAVTSVKSLLGYSPAPASQPQAAHDTGKEQPRQATKPSSGTQPNGPARVGSAVGRGAVIVDQLDTSDEPDGVQRIYRQFTHARKQILKSK